MKLNPIKPLHSTLFLHRNKFTYAHIYIEVLHLLEQYAR